MTLISGVWLLHCRIERHVTRGMSMVFLVKIGATPRSRIVRPPHDLPTCGGQQINKIKEQRPDKERIFLFVFMK